MGDRLIAGRYRLEERIGAGGMGVVWRAIDQDLGRAVALKRSQAGDSGQIRREARIGAGLHHANVVTVFDAVMDGEDRWLVMEYLPSRSLANILDTDGPLPAGVVAKIGVQLAAALAAMHDKGMVHRDLKPGNVLVAEDGTAKLTDLGIAQWAEVTRTGGGLEGGTPGYVAPEMAEGQPAGASADVFSLGATLFAAVEGTSVWGDANAGPFVQLRRATAYTLEPMRNAGPLAPVLTELLRRRPAGRPDAARAAELLGQVADVDVPVRARRFRLPKRPLAIGAGAAVLALVAGLTYVAAEQERPAPPVGTAGTARDERTADPCSLLDPAVLSEFGFARLDPHYGNYNACGVLVDQGYQAEDTVEVRLDLSIPETQLPDKPLPGQVSVRERPGEKDGKCERTIPMPDGYQVWIVARHTKDWHAHLCEYAEKVAAHAVSALNSGPIPSRTGDFEPGTLGSLDACRLGEGLTQDILGGVAEPDPVFGSWECYWDYRETQVVIRFDRKWLPLEGEGRRVDVGTRDFYVEVNETWEACQAEFPHRTYRSGGRDMIETVQIYVLRRNAPPQEMCPAAELLAKDIAPRLPPI